jgi:hypothetical protein
LAFTIHHHVQNPTVFGLAHVDVAGVVVAVFADPPDNYCRIGSRVLRLVAIHPVLRYVVFVVLVPFELARSLHLGISVYTIVYTKTSKLAQALNVAPRDLRAD